MWYFTHLSISSELVSFGDSSSLHRDSSKCCFLDYHQPQLRTSINLVLSLFLQGLRIPKLKATRRAIIYSDSSYLSTWRRDHNHGHSSLPLSPGTWKHTSNKGRRLTPQHPYPISTASPRPTPWNLKTHEHHITHKRQGGFFFFCIYFMLDLEVLLP